MEKVKELAYGVELTGEETEFLKLPNSMTDFYPLDVEAVNTGIETMAAILRMSMRETKANSSQGMDVYAQEL